MMANYHGLKIGQVQVASQTIREGLKTIFPLFLYWEELQEAFWDLLHYFWKIQTTTCGR